MSEPDQRSPSPGPAEDIQETTTPFQVIISGYSDSLEALREFVANTGRVMLEKQQLAAEEASEFFVPYHVAHLMISSDESSQIDVPEEARETLVKLRGILAGDDPEITPDKRDQVLELLRKKLPIKLVDGKPELEIDPPKIIEMSKSVKKVEAQVRLIYESVLMSLTSRSEWFVAQLMHFYYTKFEGALNQTDKIFSLRDLQEIGSISEAKQAVIEARVEDALRGPYLEWADFFKKYPKIPVDFLDADNHRIAEIFKRRNLIVHNGGRVSRKYLDSVPKDARGDYKVGDEVPLTLEYLNESLDLLERNFLLLGGEMWKKFKPADKERGQLLNNLSVDYLRKKRWYTAEALSDLVQQDNKLDEYHRMCGQINYWQTFKWSGRFAEIEQTVRSTEYSAKDPVFRLARFALLDDHDSFFRLLPKVLESDALSIESLREWPIFQGMRVRPEIAKFIPGSPVENPTAPATDQQLDQAGGPGPNDPSKPR